MSRFLPIWITESPAEGKAYVRGRFNRKVLDTIPNLRSFPAPYWSRLHKAWVVPLDKLPDVCAAFDYAGISYRIKEAEPAA